MPVPTVRHLLISLLGILAFAICGNIASAAPGDLGECQKLWLSGQYEKCIEFAAPRVRPPTPHFPRFAELKSQAEAALGKYEEACQTLKQVLQFDPSEIRNRWLLLELAPYAGLEDNMAADRREFELVISSGTARYASDVSGLITLAQFALQQQADPRQVQEVMLKRARQIFPTSPEPDLAIGQLALSKRDFPLAAEAFRNALKLSPNHPEANFGLAQALQESDREAAADLLRQVLEHNPRHAGALLSQAEALIQQEQYDQALTRLIRITDDHPRHPEALAMQSVICSLRGENEKAESLRSSALATWRRNPRVDFLIGKLLSQKYRFKAGAEAQRRALAFDPDYLPSQKQLAADLLRLGQEAEGWRLADQVYQRDEYDVASYNLVTLRDELEHFTTLEQDGLIVRMDAQEAKLYGENVMELLTEARNTLCEKYAVKLSQPILIEIFPKPADFAVRTFGLPGAGGYLGVCFGDVVTARSPASQTTSPNNWKSVLWHEFAHVITLNKTHNRMPRWLSEGISVFEERQRDPTWGERMTPEYRMMIRNGELTPISQLSGAFLSPKSSRHLLFAYFESSLVVEYIEENFGHAAMLAILDDLAVGMDINEAIERHTVPMRQLEEDFSSHVKRQALLFGWYVDWSPVDFTRILLRKNPAEELIRWAKMHPRNYQGLKTCSELLTQMNRPREAAEILSRAVLVFSLETGPQSAYAQLARLQRTLGDEAGERASLEALALMDDDASAALQRLLELNLAEQNWDGVQETASRLVAISPMIPLPHVGLAAAGEHRGDHRQAIRALRTILTLEPIDPADVHYRLALQLKETGETAPAEKEVLQALEHAPRYRDALKLLLQLQPEGPPAP
ncbi:tetratricopeptide repeat protein [Planctomicrobium sp. SH661]|uniref:tetratricopeptide repeat protein n=1 Tax=Planctomicrobium sp. SH661 TaxID=3448124 RepID=UPI003F5AF5A6